MKQADSKNMKKIDSIIITCQDAGKTKHGYDQSLEYRHRQKASHMVSLSSNLHVIRPSLFYPSQPITDQDTFSINKSLFLENGTSVARWFCDRSIPRCFLLISRRSRVFWCSFRRVFCVRFRTIVHDNGCLAILVMIFLI